MQDVFIISAVRTPIGKFGGSLASLTAADIGAVAARAAMKRAGVSPEQVQETIFGNARQAGGGPNVARQISIRSGVPKEVPAYTVNMACASGMKSIALGFDAIRNENARCVLVGGTESMSRLPYYLEGARWGYRLGNQELVDGMYRDGFFCPMAKMVMGETAEVLAEQYKITRDEQDQYALCSQKRAERAIHSGRFKQEIIPVTVERKKDSVTVEQDEHPFFGASLEKMAQLPPVFAKTGTITAGNSSGITDGAAALVVTSAQAAHDLGLRPLARIIGAGQSAVKPLELFTAPVFAMRRLMERTGTSMDSYDLFEINEAFAAQVIANGRELGIDWDRLNVNGGAIALGHPIGASGARVLVTLIHALVQRGGGRGIASLCLGGGEAVALAIEVI